MSGEEHSELDGENKDKHRWDAKDLEKMTDFHEEKDEMGEVSTESLGNLKVQQQDVKTIIIRKEDVQLIMSELDMPKFMAENKLIQHNGDVKSAIRDIIGL